MVHLEVESLGQLACDARRWVSFIYVRGVSFTLEGNDGPGADHEVHRQAVQGVGGCSPVAVKDLPLLCKGPRPGLAHSKCSIAVSPRRGQQRPLLHGCHQNPHKKCLTFMFH